MVELFAFGGKKTVTRCGIVPNIECNRRDAVSRRQGTYRSCLRRLARWIYGHTPSYDEEKAASARFFTDENETKVGSWQPSLLSYLLLRYTLEGHSFDVGAPFQQGTLTSPIHALDPWTVKNYLQRIPLYVFILGLFAVIHEVVLHHGDWFVQDFFEGTGFPAEHLLPIYSIRDGGDAFFPAIDGMPLWPFVRNGRPLVEVPGPDGTERNVFANIRRAATSLKGSNCQAGSVVFTLPKNWTD